LQHFKEDNDSKLSQRFTAWITANYDGILLFMRNK